jgi:hypothetical protein
MSVTSDNPANVSLLRRLVTEADSEHTRTCKASYAVITVCSTEAGRAPLSCVFSLLSVHTMHQIRSWDVAHSVRRVSQGTRPSPKNANVLVQAIRSAWLFEFNAPRLLYVFTGSASLLSYRRIPTPMALFLIERHRRCWGSGFTLWSLLSVGKFHNTST